MAISDQLKRQILDGQLAQLDAELFQAETLVTKLAAARGAIEKDLKKLPKEEEPEDGTQG